MNAQSGASSIRQATLDDADCIKTIALAAYAKYVARIGRKPAPMLADFRKSIAAGHVVVIEMADKPVGYRVGWPEAQSYFIEDIAVDPSHQGHSFGRLLMQDAIDHARQMKLSTLRLYTNAAMTENLSIYNHMGFVETHRAVADGYDRIYMRLVL
jgi:ribosomal protein S18 acetylase RimI-like enzyme